MTSKNLPSHWNYLPLRAIFTESDETCGDNSYELLSVTQDRGIVKQSDVDIKKDTSNDDKSKYKVVPKNSIAYNKMRMWQGAVGINEIEDGIVSPAYVVINPLQEMNTRFYFYLFKTPYMISLFGKYSYGLVDDMNTLRYDDFQKIYIPIPPLEEQNKIVEYIDKKSTQIENFIKKKTKFIALLKEQKEVVINEAVTKGIDKTVQFKDSEIEWLGNIPKHWIITKFRFLARVLNGQEQSNVIDENGDYPIYGSGGIFGKANNYMYNKPSVLLGRKGTIDKPLYTEEPFWTVDTMFYTKIYKNTFPKFFYYLCKTIDFGRYKSGSAIPSMTQSDLSNIKFAVPSYDEQKQVVEYIENKLNQIDKIIDKTTKQIDLIKEYKTSLINEAVSGKTNVR